VADYGRKIFAYQFVTEDGEGQTVSLLEPAWVFDHGLTIEAVVGFIVAPASLDGLRPSDLRENPAFLRLLSRVIYEEVGADPDLSREAARQGEGHVYLLDGRTPDPAGRVVPENILGAVAVKAGAMVAGSYQHNPRHRLLTKDGFFRLSPELEAALDIRLHAPTGNLLLRPDDDRDVTAAQDGSPPHTEA
jgi:hypothetical protein